MTKKYYGGVKRPIPFRNPPLQSHLIRTASPPETPSRRRELPWFHRRFRCRPHLSYIHLETCTCVLVPAFHPMITDPRLAYTNFNTEPILCLFCIHSIVFHGLVQHVQHLHTLPLHHLYATIYDSHLHVYNSYSTSHLVFHGLFPIE